VGKLRGIVPKPAFGVKGWRFFFPLAIVWSAVVSGVLIYQDPKDVGLGLLIVAAIGVAIYFLALPRRRRADQLADEHHSHQNPPAGMSTNI
jgi:hypothetical protein